MYQSAYKFLSCSLSIKQFIYASRFLHIRTKSIYICLPIYLLTNQLLSAILYLSVNLGINTFICLHHLLHVPLLFHPFVCLCSSSTCLPTKVRIPDTHSQGLLQGKSRKRRVSTYSRPCGLSFHAPTLSTFLPLLCWSIFRLSKALVDVMWVFKDVFISIFSCFLFPFLNFFFSLLHVFFLFLAMSLVGF